MNLPKRCAAACLFAALSAAAQTWTPLYTPTAPPRASLGAMTFDTARGKAVLFGGIDESQIPVGSTWLWDRNSWSKLPAGGGPAARYYHAMAYDEARSETILIGGAAVGYNPLPDMWSFDGTRWTQRMPASLPPGVLSPAMSWDPVRRQIVLFGGLAAYGTLSSQTWVWNGSTWTKLTPVTSPPARWFATMTWDPRLQGLILFGGASDQNYSDTWLWDGQQWRKLSSVAPEGLGQGGVAVTHGDSVLLFDGTIGKVWKWARSTWELLLTPPLGSVLEAVYDPVAKRTLTTSFSSSAVGSTWEFELGSGCSFQRPPDPVGRIPATGGSVSISFDLPPACSWSISSRQSAVTPVPFAVSPTEGKGSATVKVTVPAAESGTGERTLPILIGSREYSVVRDAPPCPPLSGPLPRGPVTLTPACPARYTFTGGAGDRIAIRASGTAEMSVSGPAPSIAVIAAKSPEQPSSGWPVMLPESGFLSLPAAGTYTVVLTAANYEFPVTFHALTVDPACTLVLVPPAVTDIDAKGTSSSWEHRAVLGVPPGCSAPKPVSSAAWLSAYSSTPDFEPFRTIFINAENNAGAPRSASVHVGNSLITYTQAGAPCPAEIGFQTGLLSTVSAGRSSGPLVIAGYYKPFECGWTATANVPWIQFAPTSGTADTLARYTIFPNFGTTVRTATASIAGRNVQITQLAEPGSEQERFVRLLYFNFFGRTATPAEVAFQVNSGLSRDQLTYNFFNSAEFNAGGRFVAGLYVGLLNRNAEYGGWLYQRDSLATGIINRDIAVANFLGSPEFQLRNGNLSNEEFVRLLYRQILLREGTPAEISFQTSHLKTAADRQNMATSFLASQEFALGTGPRLTAFLAFATLLGRDPSPGEFTWATSGLTMQQLVSGFVSSSEFRNILQ